MHILHSLSDLQSRCAHWRAESVITIGFVPTMGALHEGHMSLVHRAQRENTRCIVSIYVNPTQFNNPTDLASYPQKTEEDVRMLQAAGCDAVYFPQAAELYPQGMQAKQYDLGRLEELMEGGARPGHYQGVATVVESLLTHVQPTKAYFGLKDYQQVAVIRRMCTLLQLPVTIVACPTARAMSGLALSSRNALLSEAHGLAAPRIYQSLQWAALNRDGFPLSKLREAMLEKIQGTDGLLRVEYIAFGDPATLEPLDETCALPMNTPVQAFVVTQAGAARLIDNEAI